MRVGRIGTYIHHHFAFATFDPLPIPYDVLQSSLPKLRIIAAEIAEILDDCDVRVELSRNDWRATLWRSMMSIMLASR